MLQRTEETLFIVAMWPLLEILTVVDTWDDVLALYYPNSSWRKAMSKGMNGVAWSGASSPGHLILPTGEQVKSAGVQ